MIEHIEIENFKSLQKVSLDLGPLNIFVGANASGKTNFLEALRVLQGIGYGYTVDEIFNGRPRIGNSDPWEGTRGGTKFARFLGSEDDIRFLVRSTFPTSNAAEYAISLSPDRSIVTNERLSTPGEDGRLVAEYSARDTSFPALRETIRNRHSGLLLAFLAELSDVQFLAPVSSVQRGYSTASTAVRLGDRGENFASVVKTIQRDAARASAYTAWLKELTPAELDDIEILPGAASDWLFAFRKDGVVYPAPVLSDGTLRWAALAAAFFQPALPHTLVLEEIEDGLHPSRLHLLIELLKSQAGNGISQVFATSHSPYLLAWLREEDYRFVFLCTKDEDSGATRITPFTEVPHLIEVARRHPISELLVEGWLETAV